MAQNANRDTEIKSPIKLTNSQKLKLLESIAKNSKLTEKDVEKISEKIKKSMVNAHK